MELTLNKCSYGILFLFIIFNILSFLKYTKYLIDISFIITLVLMGIFMLVFIYRQNIKTNRNGETVIK